MDGEGPWQIPHARPGKSTTPEVDAVLEAADGRVVGIEVKANETVRTEDFGPLRHLQARLGWQRR
jgi:hypothetical protein